MISQIDILDYINSKFWQYKEVGKEILVNICPFCLDNGYHFSINRDTTQYHCFKCEEKGNIWTLAQKQGDRVARHKSVVIPVTRKDKIVIPTDKTTELHNSLLNSSKAIEYLNSRNINSETIASFKIGYSSKNNKDWIVFPHFKNGNVVNYKSRSFPEKEFIRSKGGESILYNQDIIGSFEEIIICEGEIDTLSAWQLGYKNVIGLTGGAKTFLPEWYDLLKDKKKIYLVLDNDRIGQEGAKSIARRLGYEKCFNIVLPEGIKDINDFIKFGGYDDFDFLLKKSTKFNIDNTLTVDQALDRLYSRPKEIDRSMAMDTSWDNVNSKIGQFEYGDLIVLSSPPKVGKTTMAVNIANHIIKKNIGTFFYCLEMPPESILERMAKIEKGYYWEDEAGVREYFSNKPLILGYNQTGFSVEDVMTTIKETVKRYDCRFVVLDHIHFIIRGEGTTESIGKFIRDLKGLAIELQIAIMCIAQPKKVSLTEVMNMYDLKYSSDLASDSDIMIFIQRSLQQSVNNEEGMFSKETILNIVSRKTCGGTCFLEFEGNTHRFKEDSNCYHNPNKTI